MDILILANDDEGLYQFRRELLIELIKEHSVYVIVPNGPYTQDLINIGCITKLIDFNRHGVNPWKDIQLFWKYYKLIKHINPKVVLTYTIKPNVYGGFACSILRKPYIVNITGLGSAVENGGLLQYLTIFLYRIALRKASMVFFQNTSNREFMKKLKLVNDNHELIPGSGVNLEHFHKIAYPQSDKIHFSFISRIMKEKGIEEYLEAAKSIKARYSNTIFHICGRMEQNYKSKIKQLQNNGLVVYHGNIRDIRVIHKFSNCTILPTYYPEGLSNVLLESMASCRPIITTNRSGCKELVEDGINGYVVNEKDSNDLIKKIEIFLSLTHEQKAELGRNGRKKAEHEYSRTIVVEKYLTIINKYKHEPAK